MSAPNTVVLAVGLCDEHVQKLRSAISLKGWDYLVSKDDEEAQRRFASAVDPNQSFTRDNTDPMTLAAYAIIHNVLVNPASAAELLELAGTKPPDPEKPLCPMCALHLDDWIEYALADVQEIIDGWKKTDH